MEVIGQGLTLIVILGIAALALAVWIITLIHIIRSNKRDTEKIMWLLLVIFMPFIGSLLYVFLGRGSKRY